MKKKFSIILPIYGNEKNLPVTIPYIIEHLSLFEQYDVEIIMVCDGSPDDSYEIMKQYQKEYPKLIRIAKFTKNNGQRAAVNCGMALANGDAIGVISADLQEPFELFAEMLGFWEQGENLVLAYRTGRNETGLGAQCSQLLHRFIHKHINKNYPIGGFDFFLVDKKIAKAFIEVDTENNSMQLLLLELAGKGKQLGYTRRKRELGTSGWSLKKRMTQTVNIMAIYSAAPFYFFCGVGFIGLLISVFWGIVKIIDLIRYGWGYGMAGIYFALFLIGGILTELISVTGIYLFKWMQNTRKLPRYIIEEKIDEIEV